MKMMRWIVLLMFFTAVSQAERLVYEPFDYPAGDKIGMQSGGEGMNDDKWHDISGSKGDVYVGWSGLTFADFPVAGNSLYMDFSDNTGRGMNIRRMIDKGADSGDLWASFLYKYDGDVSVAEDIMAFVRFQSSKNKSIRFRMMSCNSKNGGVAILQAGKLSSEGKSKKPSIADGKTYLIVCLFPDLGKNRGGDPVIWALNEDHYAAVKKLGGKISGEVLNANSVVSAQGKHENAVLEDADQLFFGIWGRDGAIASVSYDELRIGTEPEDVLPIN